MDDAYIEPTAEDWGILTQLNKIQATSRGYDNYLEEKPYEIPHVIGEDGSIPLPLQILIMKPEEREELARIEQESEVPWFGRDPDDLPIYWNPQVLVQKYNLHPVFFEKNAKNRLIIMIMKMAFGIII